MPTATAPAGFQSRKSAGLLVAVAPLILAVLIAPHTATAAETPDTVLIDERFDAQTEPANFGFPIPGLYRGARQRSERTNGPDAGRPGPPDTP